MTAGMMQTYHAAQSDLRFNVSRAGPVECSSGAGADFRLAPAGRNVLRQGRGPPGSHVKTWVERLSVSF